MTVKEAMPETTSAKVKEVIATKSRRKGMPVKIEVTKSLMESTPEIQRRNYVRCTENGGTCGTICSFSQLELCRRVNGVQRGRKTLFESMASKASMTSERPMDILRFPYR